MKHGQLRSVLWPIGRMIGLPSTSDLTDGQLLQRFATRHEEAAFESLLQRHGPMVLGVCRRVLNHRQDAEDAFQATFLLLVRKAGTIAKQESVVRTDAGPMKGRSSICAALTQVVSRSGRPWSRSLMKR